MATITIEDKKVKTPKFRVSFPNLEKARSYKGGEPKFDFTMLFDKALDLNAPVKNKAGKEISISMKQAAHNACVEKWGEDKAKWPKKKLKSGKIKSAVKMPFRDGDLEKSGMDGYDGAIFVHAWCKEANPPGIVDNERNKISPKDLYAGCYARASLIAFAWETGGKYGVSFSLQNIQKVGDGKKFSGKKDAEDDFDAVDDESDDASNYDEDDGEMEESDADEDDDMGF